MTGATEEFSGEIMHLEIFTHKWLISPDIIFPFLKRLSWCGLMQQVVFPRYLRHTSNNQSDFFLLATQTNTSFDTVPPPSTHSVASSSCAAVIWLADDDFKARKGWTEPTIQLGSAWIHLIQSKRRRRVFWVLKSITQLIENFTLISTYEWLFWFSLGFFLLSNITDKIVFLSFFVNIRITCNYRRARTFLSAHTEKKIIPELKMK